MEIFKDHMTKNGGWSISTGTNLLIILSFLAFGFLKGYIFSSFILVFFILIIDTFRKR